MTLKKNDLIRLEADSPLPVPVQIANWFRQAIVEGRFQPGQKLPSNGEIASKAGASCTAVQKAFAMLTREGLVSRKPRRGTFVNDREAKPTILLVFGVNLMLEVAYFYRAIQQCFQAEAARRNVKLKVFSLPLEATPELPTQEAEFQAAVRTPGVVGAILFAIDPRRVSKTLGKIPFALYQPGDAENDLLFDNAHFIRTALEHCHASGHRRLVYIWPSFQSVSYDESEPGPFLKMIAGYSFEIPQLIPLMLLNSGREHEEKACRIVQEASADWEKTGKTPDAIIVQDDIMMRPVAIALAKSGYEVPAGLVPIVRTIEEYEHHYAVPVLRYTISLRETVRALFDRLRERYNQPGRKLPVLKIHGKLQDVVC